MKYFITLRKQLAKPEVIFLVIVLFFGTIFTAITPPLWGLDEPSHFARTFQIARGQFIPSPNPSSEVNLMPDNLHELSGYRTADILDEQKNTTVFGRSDVTDRSVYDALGDRPFSEGQSFYPLIASYSPVAYIGSIVGLLISKIVNFNISETLFTTRYLSLALYAVIASMAIWLLRNHKLKWLFFVVALTPTAVFQSAVISSDGVLFALSLIFYALLYRICTDKQIDKRMLVFLAIAAIALPLVKINYIFISAAVIFIPVSRFDARKYAILYKAGVAAAASIFALMWAYITRVTEAPVVSQRADQLQVIPADQITHVLHAPLEFGAALMRTIVTHGDAFYHGLFSTISGNSLKIPVVLTIALTVILLLTALHSKEELRTFRRQIIYLNIATAGTALTIFGALYVGFTPVGWPLIDGVQGRYFWPLLIPALMLAAVIFPGKLQIKTKWIAFGAIATTAICLIVSVALVLLALY